MFLVRSTPENQHRHGDLPVGGPQHLGMFIDCIKPADVPTLRNLLPGQSATVGFNRTSEANEPAFSVEVTRLSDRGGM